MGLPLCLSAPYTEVPSVHTGTLETFTPAVRANKVCTARRAKRNNTALIDMGMDVIKQYPGPLTVSRAVRPAPATTKSMCEC